MAEHDDAVKEALKAFNESYFGPGGFFGTGSDDAIMCGHIRAAIAAFLRAVEPSEKIRLGWSTGSPHFTAMCRALAEEIDNEAR